VIDEFPYLVENDESIEAVFQSLWDRRLKKKPVLLILVGSDIAIMEQLNEYGRAFHQRGTLFPVGPLTPSETAQIVGTPDASSAFDAYLITGGLPIVCQEWPKGLTMWQYLEEALNEPSSSLVVSAQLSLAAELPATLQARTVLEKIGSGEAAFSTIQKAAGGLDPTSLKRSLETLADKRIVARDVPLSTKSSREARYRVGDPYLRFWLRFIGPNAERINRGRADLALQSIRADFSTWRGKAIEPVVRAALMSGALGPRLPSPAEEIGGWWPRSNSPEIDLVGADRGPVARTIGFVGTVKWRDSAPVTQADLTRLATQATQVPGLTSSTPLVIVSRTPVTAKGAANVFGPDDLMGAW
jgi:AAA+ ATPase superfamily predicted ATPase